MAKENINFRLIKPDDLEELGKVYARSFNNSVFKEKWTFTRAKKYLSRFMGTQPDLFFVAEVDGNLAGGTVGEIRNFWHGNIIVDVELFVDPNYWKKGIAKTLLKEILEKSIKKYKVVSFEGFTVQDVKFPLGWYERIGWKQSDLVHIAGKPEEILKNLRS